MVLFVCSFSLFQLGGFIGRLGRRDVVVILGLRLLMLSGCWSAVSATRKMKCRGCVEDMGDRDSTDLGLDGGMQRILQACMRMSSAVRYAISSLRHMRADEPRLALKLVAVEALKAVESIKPGLLQD